uniref:Uncharacterized protein n=1 Tax=Anguilla anguilla TaxID=7936 RepID=A0A0E9U8D4_ANGAN
MVSSLASASSLAMRSCSSLTFFSASSTPLSSSAMDLRWSYLLFP